MEGVEPWKWLCTSSPQGLSTGDDGLSRESDRRNDGNDSGGIVRRPVSTVWKTITRQVPGPNATVCWDFTMVKSPEMCNVLTFPKQHVFPKIDLIKYYIIHNRVSWTQQEVEKKLFEVYFLDQGGSFNYLVHDIPGVFFIFKVQASWWWNLLVLY